jgi:hypothetical protein
MRLDILRWQFVEQNIATAFALQAIFRHTEFYLRQNHVSPGQKEG